MLKRGTWLRPLVAAAFMPVSAQAADLNGVWEVQTMGGDREIRIEQKETRLVAHRVMWPEFNGEKYKLEHLYRGKVAGNAIHGDLLVKEEELPEFEVLRPFNGSIDGSDRITLDGLPLVRIKAAAPEAAPAVETVPVRPGKPQRPSDAPALSQAPPPPPPPATAVPGENEDPGASLFASIMGSPGVGNLFRVSARVTIPDEVAELLARGDALVDAGKHNAALAKYEEAAKLTSSKNLQLLHRMGRCKIKLGRYHEARDTLAQALRLDPENKKLSADYQLAKRRATRRP